MLVLQLVKEGKTVVVVVRIEILHLMSFHFSSESFVRSLDDILFAVPADHWASRSCCEPMNMFSSFPFVLHLLLSFNPIMLLLSASMFHFLTSW